MTTFVAVLILTLIVGFLVAMWATGAAIVLAPLALLFGLRKGKDENE